MTTLRLMRPEDVLRMNLTNLDPLTENYNVDYYMQYISKWPSLQTVAEDQDGNIIGYSIHVQTLESVQSAMLRISSDWESRRGPCLVVL